MKKNKIKNKIKTLFSDFKKFISKGNVVDMAVGVVIGAAFSAIITAVVQQILMPIITWAIPSGGIDGLVTVLNPDVAKAPAGTDPSLVVNYWGVDYLSSKVNVINWGAFINALIYFLIVALLLFTVVKIFGYLNKKRESYEKAALEKYYQRHPEERPSEKEAAPTQNQLLERILIELKKQNESLNKQVTKAETQEE